jgi:hypothetical protein
MTSLATSSETSRAFRVSVLAAAMDSSAASLLEIQVVDEHAIRCLGHARVCLVERFPGFASGIFDRRGNLLQLGQGNYLKGRSQRKTGWKPEEAFAEETQKPICTVRTGPALIWN